MPSEVETVCTKCGKPVAKSGSITQWIFDPSRCGCTIEKKTREVSVCSLCNLPLRPRAGTITQWIFRPKTCTCLHSYPAGEFFSDSKMPEDDAIAGAPYHFLSIAAQGGLGTVYKAQNQKLGRPVAVKVLAANEDSRAVQNFMREAKSCSLLQHPNILSILDFGTMTDNRHFLVTEWIDGVTMAQFMSRHGKLSIELSKEIFSQILDGLSHAHNRGVVHRDIKPSNIMLTRTESGDWRVKIIDFGAAKEFAKDGFTTRIEDMAVSPFYMSPEQCTGAQIDHRSDFYSLGCTWFEALTGNPPFTGRPLMVITRHQSEQPRSLSAASGSDFPQSLENLISRLLAKNPAERFDSAQEVKEFQFSEGDGISSASTTRTQYASPPKRDLAWLYIGLATVFLISVIGFTLIGTEKQLAGMGGQRKSRQTDSGPTSDRRIGAPTAQDLDVPIVQDFGNSLSVGGMISKSGLEPYKNRSKLRTVDFQGCTIPSFALASLRNLHITTVSFRSTENAITDEHIEQLAQYKYLMTLRLVDTRIPDSAFLKLAKLKMLRDLDVSFNDFDDSNISSITTLPYLERLKLKSTRITDHGLKAISSMKSLKRLDLTDTQVTSNGLSLLTHSRLEYVMLSDTSIKSDGITKLSGLRCLRTLFIYGDKLRLADLETLVFPSTLKTLYLRDCPLLTQAEVNKYRKRHPKVEVSLYIPPTIDVSSLQ